MALNMIKGLPPGIVRYPGKHALWSASRGRKPLKAETFSMGQLRSFSQSMVNRINEKQKSRFPDKSHGHERSFTVSRNYWHLFKPGGEESLVQEGFLRLVFWNIHFEGPNLESRGLSAIGHLKEVFGNSPTSMIIILQGVHRQSLEAICKTSWIRENFVLSNAKAPQPCFTLVMASRDIPTESWFRVISQLERDALVVDIPISSR
ncbi:hypothetical protein B0O99DRAFT_678626 [Bisporella sp. PMI_857]|nr:hypothetical protein B0O99DRAFT_678626 [Bisporella sp. PMI_857]